jgi:hypothetical protein
MLHHLLVMLIRLKASRALGSSNFSLPVSVFHLLVIFPSSAQPYPLIFRFSLNSLVPKAVEL